MKTITTKLVYPAPAYERHVYADGVLIGTISEKSNHYQGQFGPKLFWFSPVAGGPVAHASAGKLGELIKTINKLVTG